MRLTTAKQGNVINFNSILHPHGTFEHPNDVVVDPSLTTAEKRAILASWASDAAAVPSSPAFRAPVGAKKAVTIDEVMAALHALDGGPWQPPGGKPMRLRSTERRAALA